MKRFLSSLTLCVSLLMVGLLAFMPATEAQDNLLIYLIELPAPPPPNPLINFSRSTRGENFYDKNNPPPDNAPIEDLLDYWRHQNENDPNYIYTVKPSAAVFARLREQIEKSPDSLSGLLTVLPDGDETVSFVKKLYDLESVDRKLEKSWRDEVKQWLTYNSTLYADDLLKKAQQAADTDEYVTNQNEVLALARIDWDRARPLLEKMLGNSSQPISQTLARWAFYKHAQSINDSFDVDKYRRMLQETVENKSMQPGNRDLAMDALVESGDFPGRDEWYFKLLEDETLFELRVNGEVYTGLTTLLNHSPSDKYIEKMIELAGSGNPSVRRAAIRNLSMLLGDTKNPAVIRALLPWLENPKWAVEAGNERRELVQALGTVTLPESVPGLIAALNEKEVQEVGPMTNSSNTSRTSIYASNIVSANASSSNSSILRERIEVYPLRSAAVTALEKQKDQRAIAPLRQVLPLVENWELQNVVRALLSSSGFSVAEQLEALEAVAKGVQRLQSSQLNTMNPMNAAANSSLRPNTSTVDDEKRPSSMVNALPANTLPSVIQSMNPKDLKIILGNQLINSEEVSGELIGALIARINELDRADAPAAAALRPIIQNWKGAPINAMMLNELKHNRAGLDTIVKLLTIRKELREKQLDDVFGLRGGTPRADGIAACLLEDANEYDAILEGEKTEAKIALFGCARLIRAALPLQKAAENLQSSDKLLATAAERYLEAEDSPAARRFVLARHPNEAKIMGAKSSFVPIGAPAFFSEELRNLFASVNPLFQNVQPYFFYSEFAGNADELERALQKELGENRSLLGIYTYEGNYIRIFADKAVFSWQRDPARYRERRLDEAEFENLKNYLAGQRVDELPPFLTPCPDCQGKQLIMVGPGGGRRIYQRAEQTPQFFADLEGIFADLRTPPARLRYRFEDKIAGLEILWADENLPARNLWKNGDDFRLLIEDLANGRKIEMEREDKERDNIVAAETGGEENEEVDAESSSENERQKYDNHVWRRFDKNGLSDAVPEPSTITQIPPVDGFPAAPGRLWKTRAGAIEIRADEEGLYKISGGKFSKIRQGYYDRPLITPNGRWAVALKYPTEESEDGYEVALVRINLLTGREYKIKVAATPSPIAYLPALGGIIVFGGYRDYDKGVAGGGQHFLLDAETGLVQNLKGEVRPLGQQTYRPLQRAAASPDLFWAAIPDESKKETSIGFYNAKTLSFKSLLTLPEITFDSMQLWADETEKKLYFIYEGQLLSLPLPKNP